jgi:hypothetical protein
MKQEATHKKRNEPKYLTATRYTLFYQTNSFLSLVSRLVSLD